MKNSRTDQVFNLFDTNGRRADVINAYTIYMEILRELMGENGSIEWKSYPKSWTQFQFYEQAIVRSPEVFSDHPKYDYFIEKLKDKSIKTAFQSKSIEQIGKLEEGKKLLKILDVGIEDRARHYTSNLVKIGFVDKNRRITPIGMSFIDSKPVIRGDFEKLLPIDNTNLIFLRQLLKLRVYSTDGKTYYNPMMMCLYILYKSKRMAVSSLRAMIQLISPDYPISHVDFYETITNASVEDFESNYIRFDSGNDYEIIAGEKTPMERDFFNKKFKNRKSSAPSEYYEFYLAVVNFCKDRSEESLEVLYHLQENERKRDSLDKAFGYGVKVFKFDKSQPYDVNKFLELNEDNIYLTSNNLNATMYSEFQGSKRHDTVMEYSDTTMRLLSVTGVISMKNGIVTFKYGDIWNKLLDYVDFEELIFVSSEENEWKAYETSEESIFFNHISLEELLEISDSDVNSVIKEVQYSLSVAGSAEVRATLIDRTNEEFKVFIDSEFPKSRVEKLLAMFSDRNNDKDIQKELNSKASVPTIFEYIMGLAWYHISKESYDVFSSFNLTMNADFLPETHAGGGDGDIIVRYDNGKIVMLEVTLMNKQAQKRGEWEPVLRHATNLVIDEPDKDVTTIFVADELDSNTINIWRAVASVPLKSSREFTHKEKYAENVTIMPLKNMEVISILNSEINETELLANIHESFDELTSDFDLQWRNKILSSIGEE